jgi:hypothetical protein
MKTLLKINLSISLMIVLFFFGSLAIMLVTGTDTNFGDNVRMIVRYADNNLALPIVVNGLISMVTMKVWS